MNINHGDSSDPNYEPIQTVWCVMLTKLHDLPNAERMPYDLQAICRTRVVAEMLAGEQRTQLGGEWRCLRERFFMRRDPTAMGQKIVSVRLGEIRGPDVEQPTLREWALVFEPE